jgi:6-phosphogluconolactonase (cycloisomerase 2 family)
MRQVRTLILVIVGLTILFGSGLFGAVPIADAAAAHAVFVQTNDPSANAIRVYDRASNGKLSFAASYATGGLGGSTIGAPTDALSSQGSLTFDAADGLLFAVNAGSDTVTVFAVSGDQLRRTQVVASGGDFPVSLTAEHGLVYVLNGVLNGGGDGSVSGYRVNGDQLVPIPGSIRSLGLNNTTPPNFLSSPGQVTLSPSGGQLIIPTKSNGVIDVFRINPTGRPSATPIQNPSAGAVPFTASFDASGHLIVTEAGGVAKGEGSVSSYVLNPNGTLTTVSAAVANGQTATCWDAFSRGFLYAVNTGSSTISGYVDAQGSLSLLDPSGVTAPTNAGPIDVASSGSFLYVEESLTGTLGEFSVASDGSLTRIGTITGLPVFSNGNGMEGIAAA